MIAARRGDVVAMAGGGPYAGQPRPAVVIQSDAFPETGSLTFCLITGQERDFPLLRLAIVPDALNSLRKRSWIMLDKIVSVPRNVVRERFGHLGPADQTRLDRALLVFLGIA